MSADKPEGHLHDRPPMPSRAAVIAEHETRRAERLAREAHDEARRADLQRDAWVLGRVGCTQGFELALVAVQGHVVVKAPSPLTAGAFIFAISFDQAQQVADLLEQGEAGCVEGVDRRIRVERTHTGCQLRDPAIAGHAGVDASLNSHQAASFAALLRRVGGKSS